MEKERREAIDFLEKRLRWMDRAIISHKKLLQDDEEYEKEFDHAIQNYLNCRNHLKDSFFSNNLNVSSKEFYVFWNGWISELGEDKVLANDIIHEVRNRLVHSARGSVSYLVKRPYLTKVSGSPFLLANGKKLRLRHRPEVTISPSTVRYKQTDLLEHARDILKYVIEKLKGCEV